MTELPTPTQVALRLAQLDRALDTGLAELDDADEKAVRARQRYEVTEARAFLDAEASNAETKKRLALLAAADAKLDVEIADLLVRKLKRSQEKLSKQVNIAQSMGTAVRQQWAATT